MNACLRYTLAIALTAAIGVSVTAEEKDKNMKAEPAKKVDMVVKRTFDAPVEQVWKSWTESEQVMKWWGPTGFTCPLAKMDVREGGTTLVCMRAPKEFGGQDMYSTWVYKKIVPMKSMEYIHNLADKDGKAIDPTKLGMPADFPQNQRHVLTLNALDNGKTELTMTEYGWTVGKMLEMSELGFNQCMDKMAESFKKPTK